MATLTMILKDVSDTDHQPLCRLSIYFLAHSLAESVEEGISVRCGGHRQCGKWHKRRGRGQFTMFAQLEKTVFDLTGKGSDFAPVVGERGERLRLRKSGCAQREMQDDLPPPPLRVEETQVAERHHIFFRRVVGKIDEVCQGAQALHRD